MAMAYFSYASASYAQTAGDSTANPDTEAIDTSALSEKPPLEFVFKPTIGLGVGMFTFMGDVSDNHKGFHPEVSRIGYELRVNNKLTDYLDLGFYILWGKVSSNERSLTRNLNFESRIRTGGATLSYNFHHILPLKRIIEPYVFTGFESFEFLSKTDLYDRYGNLYHYWSDGSIRNMAENDPNAINAVQIYRDYTYESDLREQNLDGFGKYRERSWSVPVGVGFQFLMGERLRFRMGTSMHLTFTDLVDNVSDASQGDRKGNKGNDKFLYTSFSLNYDIRRIEVSKKPDIFEEEFNIEDYQELLARDTADADRDKVTDLLDDCQNTPPGVPVDAKGCPFDKDKDLVRDFMDDEVPTPTGNYVDEKGVTLTDDDFELRYRKYKDSTGIYHGGGKLLKDEIAGYTGNTNDNPETNNNLKSNLTYFVVVGSTKTQVTANDLYKYLGYKDFKTVESGDSIFFMIGNYKTVAEALARKEQLDKQGIKTQGLAKNDKTNNKTDRLSDKEIKDALKDENNTPVLNDLPANKELVFRVQVGAYQKKVSGKVFKDVPGLVIVPGPDGIVRYYSQTYDNLNDATKSKVDLNSKGYDGAFIVAYKDGKRVPLEEAGAHMVNEKDKDNIDESKDLSKTHVDKKLVKFRVQVGAYRNDIPAEVLDLLLFNGNVKVRKSEDGLSLYLVGEVNSYEEAEALKQQLIKQGLKDSFIIGEFNGKLISAKDALEILK